MSIIRRIVFIVYDGFELIDLSGPSSVFSAANDKLQETAYKIVVASPSGWLVTSRAGLQVATTDLDRIRWQPHDTALVVGAHEHELKAAMNHALIVRKLQAASTRTERYGSVCSGAFVLAAAGLLNNKQCTTHWSATSRLSQYCSKAMMHDDALHVTDERLWTSAGASAGIDMALAMLEDDHGPELMGHVAKWLVLYARRPGNQSQFSSVLHAQTATQGTFAPVADWLQERLEQPIRVEDMARQVSMSERTFYRRFTQAVGVTPSKYLETLRLDRAKTLLETGEAVKVVATSVGFQSHAAFRTAFKTRFGTTPSLHAQMFQGESPCSNR